MRIAVVGSGVSGLVCAHLLSKRHDVTIFEADDRLGGHAHTQQVELDGETVVVDTGFIVYNERNYPVLSALFGELGVRTRPSEMSFAMADDHANIEWCGTSLRSVFVQKRNLFRRAFWRMLRDIARFNREAQRDLSQALDLDVSLAVYLERGGFSQSFIDWYLVPMGAAIWSANPQEFTQFPAVAFLRFFANHGLLGLRRRPQWRTVVGGSQNYVQAIVARFSGQIRLATPVVAIRRLGDVVEVATSEQVEIFDHVIMACHADQALAILSDARVVEKEVLGAITFQPNEAVLHTDVGVMPRRKFARASWNWRRQIDSRYATLSYDLTRLQGLTGRPLYLTLNQTSTIDPASVISMTSYDHPVFDLLAMAAQRRHGEISGHHGVSFVGAYWGYGFHEDGAASALRVCRALDADLDVVTL